MPTFMAILETTGEVFVFASPFILLGLSIAALLHVAIQPGHVARWLGRPGLGSMTAAAFLGIPLPLCSCSVVPVTIELSRKGASREASLAFMVTTPETGVDSIVLTYGLMGPVMAVARPLSSLVTGLVAASISLFAGGGTGEEAGPGAPAPEGGEPRAAAGRALRYGFVRLVDEIGFWLVAGFVLTGLVTALVPEDLLRGELGRGPLGMVTLLLLGIPLYMCASASTPVAAALMLKGASPGAALVFLLAGPATNASSLTVIARFFGRSFVKIYLASVVAVSLASGLALDAAVGALGWELQPTLGIDAREGGGPLFWASAAALLGLLAWSVLRGAWRRAFRDLAADLRRWSALARGSRRPGASGAGRGGAGEPREPRLPYRGRRHLAPVTGAPALETRSLTVAYPGARRPALRGIELQIPVGAQVALVGPNGAGKSTLLKVTAGLLAPREGEVRIYGLPAAACHHRVAYLPQRSEVDWRFPLTVERLVLAGRYVHLGWLGRVGRHDRAAVAEVLERLGLWSLRGEQVGRLSGGQQQRALLGRALVQEADLLLLDEPLNAVDTEARQVVAGVLAELKRRGKTVLVATHDIGRLEGDFDGAVYLSEGQELPAPPGAFVGASFGDRET